MKKLKDKKTCQMILKKLKDKKKTVSSLLDDVQAGIGVRRIFDRLSHSQVPIVAHNMSLDMSIIYQNFHRNLPKSLKDFKQELSVWLPNLTDTKILANFKKCFSFKNTSLEDLRTALSVPPFSRCFKFVCDVDTQKLLSSSSYHNAAYDSLMTGECYLIMKNHLEHNLSKLESARILSSSQNRIPMNADQHKIMKLVFINLAK